MTRDEIQTVYDAGSEAVSALVTGLLQRIDELTARVTERQRRLGRNSRNRRQPPAQDGFQKQTKSRREKSERPVGGQARASWRDLAPAAAADRKSVV